VEAQSITKDNFFMYFLIRKILLAKDNHMNRQLKGCKKCRFCDVEESIEHICFFQYPFCKIVWHIVFNTYDWKLVKWYRQNMLEYEFECLLCVGQFGKVGTMLSLTMLVSQILYRLSIWLHTGSKIGLSCSWRSNRNLWLLNATVCRGSFRISIARLVGGFLGD
jgi:hypothetical protein